MSDSLFVKTLNYINIAETIAEIEDDDALIEHINEARIELVDKIAAVSMYVKSCQGLVELKSQRIREMCESRKQLENRIERLQENVINSMKALKVKDVGCADFTVSIRKNPQRCRIYDASLIPEEYFRQPSPVPDIKRISQEMKEGVVIDGARLEQSERISIK